MNKYLVAKLIQLFNGEIDVVSEKGKGSTFIVRLKNIEISTSQGLTEKNKILQHEVISSQFFNHFRDRWQGTIPP